MRIFLFFLSIFLFATFVTNSLLVTAQNSTAFRKNYNLFAFDVPSNIIEGLVPNNYMLCGSDPAFGITIVSQLNDTGNVIWSYNYSASSDFLLNDIKKDISGNQYYLCGGSETDPAVFMFLDNNGNILLSKRFIISEADGAVLNRVIKTSDGGYVAVGYVTGHDPDGGGAEIKFSPITYTDDDGQSRTDYIASPLIVKFDASGNQVWHKVFRYYYTSNIPVNRIYNDASFSDVVEVSDGYVAVGSYDVNEFRSVQNSDSSDATPTDALLLKVTTAGAITYHKQIDNPNNSTSQSSKYLSAVNKTSAGDIISVGNDGIKELIQKYNGSGAFVNSVSRLFTYSFTTVGTCPFCIVTPDPCFSSQIYEVSGSSDLITIGTNVKLLAPWVNSLHRVNSTATTSLLAKTYDFDFAISFLPVGSLTSDGGYIMATMNGGSGGTDYDFHVIKTDNNGDTPLTGCPANSLSPSGSAGPTTFADPFYNSWSGTPGSNAITITKASIGLSSGFVCTKISCTAPLAATTVTATPSTICQGQSTTITASGSGGGVTYNVYTTPTGGSSIGSTPLTISPSSTTTYYVETAQTSDASCVSTTRTSVTVTVNTAAVPTITPSGATSFCTGGSVTLTSSLASSYSWSNGGSGQSITVSASGSYVVTVTYANTCTNTSAPTTVTVNNNPTPTIIPSGATSFCQGNSVTLTSSAANSYSWTGGATSPSINVTTAGTYNVTVTDGNGCIGSASSAVTITVNNNPTPVITGASSVCSNANANYSVTNTGNSYSWSISNGTINSGQGTNSISVTWNASGAANISVTETNSNSCTGNNTMNVTINSSLNPTITASGSTNICAGNSVTLDAGSGYLTYLWSESSTTQTISVSASGTYSVTVTDGSGCSGSSSSPVTITVNNNPTPTITASGSTTICQGDSVLLDAGSGYSNYLWNTSETTQTIYADSSGNYSVTVTDGNGCSGTSSVATTINVISIPVVTISSSGSTTFCQGDSITLDAGSYANYLWNTGATTQTIVVNSSGNYSVSVTDSNGCSNDSSTTSTAVTVNPNPVISISGNATVCDGDTVFLTANSTAISFLWNTGDTTSQISILTSQIYFVTATDSNNCSATDSVQVNFFPSFPDITQSLTICDGDSFFVGGSYQTTSGLYYDSLQTVDGCDSIIKTSLTVLQSSVFNVDSSICNGDSAFFQGNFQNNAGIYYDTLQSVLGCDSILVTTLSINQPAMGNQQLSICIGDSTFVGGNWQDTSGTYYDTIPSVNNCDSIIATDLTILQNTNSTLNLDSCYTITINSQTYFTSGTYTQIIPNAEGCDSTITLNLTIKQGASSALDTTYCDVFTLNSQTYTSSGTYTQILVNSVGCDSIITLNLILNFSDSANSSANICAGETYVFGSQNLTTTGNYSETFTNINGCDSIVNLTLIVNPAFSTQMDDTICSNDSILLAGNFQNTSGIYYDTLQSANGCDSLVQTNLTVLVAPNPDSAGASPDAVTIFFRDTAHLTAAAPATATLFWSPSEFLSCTDCPNPIANPDSTTVYYLTVSSANGCSVSDSVIVTVEYPPSDVFVPNIFSPNGDLENDILYVYGRYIDRIEWTIFDRWGEKVFYCEGKKEECGWDGKYRGKDLNPAVFVYYLKVTLFDKSEIFKKGNVTLLK